jgi:hypothetical protein
VKRSENLGGGKLAAFKDDLEHPGLMSEWVAAVVGTRLMFPLSFLVSPKDNGPPGISSCRVAREKSIGA